ncbi:MAG: SH3 domain-containing protein [Bdellovibrionales bacterium]
MTFFGLTIICVGTLLITRPSHAQEIFSPELNPPEKVKAAPKSQVKKASPKAIRAKTTRAQSAVVGLDGATVYAAPDFDAKIIIQLQPGYKVLISRKALPGVGGVGLFYRIKYAGNKLGFVADNEMIPEYQSPAKQAPKNPVFNQVEDMRERALSGREPISLTRYLGASISRVNYKEKYRGQSLSSEMLMYGLRFTGPGVLFDGPPLDLNLTFSPKAPDHYQDLTGTPASGWMVMFDTLLSLSFLEWENMGAHVALGGMLNYTRFRVKEGFDYTDSQHFRLGAVGEVGAAYRHKKIVVRGDIKYHYESSSYLTYLLSLQHEY